MRKNEKAAIGFLALALPDQGSRSRQDLLAEAKAAGIKPGSLALALTHLSENGWLTKALAPGRGKKGNPGHLHGWAEGGKAKAQESIQNSAKPKAEAPIAEQPEVASPTGEQL